MNDDVMEHVLGPLGGTVLCGLGAGWPGALAGVSLWAGIHAWLLWLAREQQRRDAREEVAFQQTVKAWKADRRAEREALAA